MRRNRDTAPGNHLAVARKCLPSERRLARPAGLEPATLGLEGPMSDRLYEDDYMSVAS